MRVGGASGHHRRTLTRLRQAGPASLTSTILQLASSACKTSRIHKPSAVVSFGLPDPLSFLVRGLPMVAADREQTSTGKATWSGRKAGLTRHLGECNVCKDPTTNPNTQKI